MSVLSSISSLSELTVLSKSLYFGLRSLKFSVKPCVMNESLSEFGGLCIKTLKDSYVLYDKYSGEQRLAGVSGYELRHLGLISLF